MTFGGHFGSYIENMKNVYQQLFHAKIYKTSIYIKYQTSGFILIYCFIKNTVSHFSYAPLFQGPHFLTKMLESNILYDNLLIDILSV